MKKILTILVPVILAFTIGILFMDVSKEKDIMPVMSDGGSVKIFQSGVFTSLEEATMDASLKKGIVMQEDEYYNVYLAFLKKSSNIERMIEYLDSQSIYYYLKDGSFDPTFNDVLNHYEDLMASTTSMVAFNQLNKKILERYKVLYEG